MKLYQLRRDTAEVKVKSYNRDEVLESLEPGCLYMLPDGNPEVLCTFESKETALKVLKNNKSKVGYPFRSGLSCYVRVTEYYVQEVETESERDYEYGWFDVLDPVAFAEFEK